jgi:hypothetical protein
MRKKRRVEKARTFIEDPKKIQTPALYLSICLCQVKFKYMINHCPTANTPLPPKPKLGNQISCSGNS